MNRIKISKNSDRFGSDELKEIQMSLQIIKDSHISNEQIVDDLRKNIANEQQQRLCDALQKDMKLINDQLQQILKHIDD